MEATQEMIIRPAVISTFGIIVPEKPERWMMGALREELEMLHADVVFVTPQYFEHDNSKFTQQLRRGYKELKI